MPTNRRTRNATRRSILALTGAALAASPAHAQTQKTARIGFLSASDPEPAWTLFRQAMTSLGHVEGRSIAYDYRAGTGSAASLDPLAAEMVAKKVDIIVALFTPSAVAAKRATTSIPILFNGGGTDIGLVKNIARPEANITGVFSPGAILGAKCLQLFRELKPSAKAIGALFNEPDPFHIALKRETEAAARVLQVEFVPAMLKSREELPRAFETMAARGVDGVLVQPSLGLEAAGKLALANRVPAFATRRGIAEHGGLFTYSPADADVARILASYADRLLKGTRVADLPAQETPRFELVVNLKTARTIGLPMSPVFLSRADEVIE